MKQSRLPFNLAGIALLSATAFGIGASVTSSPTMMSARDYEALRVAITIESEDDLSMCNRSGGNARLACQAEARADQRTQLADLEMKYRGTYEAARQAQTVKIRANYDKARAKCFGLSGYQRDSCIVKAHVEKARALMAAQAVA